MTITFPVSDRPQVANHIYEGELYLRCPYCGDSDSNQWKAHLSVRLIDGLYFCFKCHARGKLTTQERISLIGFPDFSQITKNTKPSYEVMEDVLNNLLPGSHSGRGTALTTYHYLDEHGLYWDTFLGYDFGFEDSDPIGVLLRRSGTDKRAYVYGDRGYSWSTAPESLVSSSINPIRIVEGPYDVLTDQDVCVFGMITETILDVFKNHYIILCPDGDIISNPKNFKIFKRLLWKLLFGHGPMPYLVGVEILPDNLDPDQVPVNERPFATPAEIKEHWFKPIKRKLR